MPYVIIGVDGGGTHSRLVAVRNDGHVLGRAEGGSINYKSVPLETCRRNLSEGINLLLNKLGLSGYDYLSVGHSAWCREESEEEKRRFLGDAFSAKTTYMHNDVYMALMGATFGRPGIMLISGTGSMCAGLDVEGRIYFLGGWGYLFGDEGSCYHIAIQGLRAAVHAYEGAIPTGIVEKLLARYRINDLRELLNIFYNPPVSVRDIASIAQDVLACAEEGDAVAREIVDNAVKILAELTLNMSQRIRLPSIHVGVYGGLFEHNHQILQHFKEVLSKSGQIFTVSLPEFPPELGAVIHFFMENQLFTDEVLSNIRRTFF